MDGTKSLGVPGTYATPDPLPQSLAHNLLIYPDHMNIPLALKSILLLIVVIINDQYTLYKCMEISIKNREKAFYSVKTNELETCTES